MKKNTRIIVALFLVTSIAIIYLFYNNSLGYKYLLKRTFGLNFDKVKLHEIERREKWLSNGDGEKLIIFDYENLKNLDISSLNELPMIEDIPPTNMPLRYMQIEIGYYKYIEDKNDYRNFSLLIIDTTKKQIYVFFQIM